MEPEFDPYVTDYTVHYTAGTQSVTLTAEKDDVLSVWGNGADDETLVLWNQWINGNVSVVYDTKPTTPYGYEEPDEVTVTINTSQSGLTKTVVFFRLTYNGRQSVYRVTLLPETE